MRAAGQAATAERIVRALITQADRDAGKNALQYRALAWGAPAIVSFGAHFIVARYNPAMKIVYLTTDTYSQTTAKHLTQVTVALAKLQSEFGYTIVKVDDPKYVDGINDHATLEARYASEKD